MNVYTEEEVLYRIRKELPEWTYRNKMIVREVQTEDWRTTLLVTMMIGYLAERTFHHPDLHLSYDRIVISLQTHDAGGITDKDFALAELIESALKAHDRTSSPFSGPPYPFIVSQSDKKHS